jgi:hypothetical protein
VKSRGVIVSSRGGSVSSRGGCPDQGIWPPFGPKMGSDGGFLVAAQIKK